MGSYAPDPPEETGADQLRKGIGQQFDHHGNDLRKGWSDSAREAAAAARKAQARAMEMHKKDPGPVGEMGRGSKKFGADEAGHQLHNEAMQLTRRIYQPTKGFHSLTDQERKVVEAARNDLEARFPGVAKQHGELRQQWNDSVNAESKFIKDSVDAMGKHPGWKGTPEQQAEYQKMHDNYSSTRNSMQNVRANVLGHARANSEALDRYAAYTSVLEDRGDIIGHSPRFEVRPRRKS